jgi:hypothetical protein
VPRNGVDPKDKFDSLQFVYCHRSRSVSVMRKIEHEWLRAKEARGTRKAVTHFPADSNTNAYSSYNIASRSPIPFANKNR